MGRPDALAAFIEEAADRFPAEKYGLTLFDHGGGNTGGYVDTGPPGTTAMTIPDIRAGMAAGMARAGIDRFDLLYHAACLMSSYETASALAPLAETMAGSEELMIQSPCPRRVSRCWPRTGPQTRWAPPSSTATASCWTRSPPRAGRPTVTSPRCRWWAATRSSVSTRRSSRSPTRPWPTWPRSPPRWRGPAPSRSSSSWATTPGRPTSSTSGTSCATSRTSARRRGRPGRGVRGPGGFGQRPGPGPGDRAGHRPQRLPAAPTPAGSVPTSRTGRPRRAGASSCEPSSRKASAARRPVPPWTSWTTRPRCSSPTPAASRSPDS